MRTMGLNLRYLIFFDDEFYITININMQKGDLVEHAI